MRVSRSFVALCFTLAAACGGDDGQTLKPPGPGEALLTSTVPDTREDESALFVTELTGYEIPYTSPSRSTETVTINDPAQTSHRLSDLSPGDHTFDIVAIDISGVRSMKSNTATKTIEPSMTGARGWSLTYETAAIRSI